MAGLHSPSLLLSPDLPRYLRLPLVPEAYFETLVTRLPSPVPATGWPPCLPSRASPSLSCHLFSPRPFSLPVFPIRCTRHDLRVDANRWRLRFFATLHVGQWHGAAGGDFDSEAAEVQAVHAALEIVFACQRYSSAPNKSLACNHWLGWTTGFKCPSN